MKKIYGYIISVFTFFLFFSLKVNAAEYQGDLGYIYSPSSTEFYLLVNDDTVEKVELHIDGIESVEMSKESDVYRYVYTASDLNNTEYYYNICYTDSTCVAITDPFALTSNHNGDRNVILDVNSFSIGTWEGVSIKDATLYNNSIYALEAEKFVDNLEIVPQEGEVVTNSVFSKLSTKTTMKNQNGDTKDIVTGYEYLTKIGMKYLEVGNLYDSNNYFYPNTKFSSNIDKYSSIEEYQKFINAYKRYNMNVIARMDILNPGETLKNNFSVLNSDYIIDGKLNLANQQIQRYIKDLYRTWVEVYKIDGFYIIGADEYGKDLYDSLINELKDIIQGKQLFIYSDSNELGIYHTSDTLQDAMYGSLLDNSSNGVINGEFTKDSFSKLINAMFSGKYSDMSKYYESNYTINNFGSIEGLDVYSKMKIVSGTTSKASSINDKVKIALQLIFSSAGIPRIVSGNEFYNNTPVNEFDSDFESVKKICAGQSSFCYAIGTDKKIEWLNSRGNSYQLNKLSNYRQMYMYQFPSFDSMRNMQTITYNEELVNKGILYLIFEYKTSRTGDMEKSILIVNFSTQEEVLDSLSQKDYSEVAALVGKVEVKEENIVIKGLTFFTYSELRGNNVPQWAYILICLGLVFLIFGIRGILIKQLKDKRGIDYKEYAYELKKGRKKKHKEPSAFSQYLSENSIFKKKKNKKEENEKDSDQQIDVKKDEQQKQNVENQQEYNSEESQDEE